MRAAQWQAPGSVRAGVVDDPAPGAGEALVEVAWCGICGSDLHAFRSGRGISPGHVLGHELSGRVLSAPDVTGLRAGDRVAVRPVLPCGGCPRCVAGEVNLCERQVLLGFDVAGGMAERVVIPRACSPDALLRIPESVELRAAALVEPLAVGLRAARLAGVAPADGGLVLGCGPIGLAAIHFLAAAGVQPLVGSDPSPLRRSMALAMGATATIDPTGADAGDVLAAALGARAAFDLAIDCAGVENAIATALRSLRRGGRLVLAALHGRKVPVSLDRIVGGEVSVLGSFAYRDELRRVLELMAAGRLDAARMITHELALDDVQDAFDLQTRADESIKVLLRLRP